MQEREAQATIEALAAALVWEQDSATELQGRLAEEVGHSARLLAERGEARKELAKEQGHNLLLQDRVNQLQERLTALQHPDIEAEIRENMRLDQSDPDIAAMLAGKPPNVRPISPERCAPAHLDITCEAAADAAASLDLDTE